MLISALREAGRKSAGAESARRRQGLCGHPELTRLRIAAVAGSFLSAVSTLGFCTLAFASDAEWPLIGVWAVSAAATLAILAFFTALRRSLVKQAMRLQVSHEMFCAALRGMAEEQVLDLEAKQLLRHSQDDPELANAILAGIVREYTDAEQSAGRSAEPDRGHTFSVLVDKVTKPANQDHLIARTLRRLASDVDADVSEAR
ncbi:hypothetical protein [Streptomyces sp. NPDC002537]